VRPGLALAQPPPIATVNEPLAHAWGSGRVVRCTFRPVGCATCGAAQRRPCGRMRMCPAPCLLAGVSWLF
jgi:hypothetical protein